MTPRATELLVADLLMACAYAAEVVARGKGAWDDDVVVRLAGEAIVGRLGDGAAKLPSEIRTEMSEIPWQKVVRIRILADHVYHRIVYDDLWVTLRDDVPQLAAALARWRAEHAGGR